MVGAAEPPVSCVNPTAGYATTTAMAASKKTTESFTFDAMLESFPFVRPRFAPARTDEFFMLARPKRAARGAEDARGQGMGPPRDRCWHRCSCFLEAEGLGPASHPVPSYRND